MFTVLLSAVLVLPHGMASIPAGSYRALLSARGASTRVAAFALDREPVSRRDFLAFVRANPHWRKSAITSAFAEPSYLSDWPSDLDAGDAEALTAPVRNVSWFAARAYCESKHKRLPTTDEWEYVAAADETRRDATSDPSYIQRLLGLYTSQRGSFRNVYGVDAMHGGVWEWTDDFNGPMPAHHHDLNCAGAALGTSDPSNYPAFLRSTVRSGLTGRTATSHLGFRCARG